MKIGIDISQIVFERGVSRYTRELVSHLLQINKSHEFVLFGTSLRQRQKLNDFISSQEGAKNFKSKIYPIPPTLLEILFNRLRFSVDPLIGEVDVFHSSDWTQPKTRAKKVTTIHDLIAHKLPELFDKKTIEVQKRRIELVKKEVAKIITVSENSKKDIIETLGVSPDKIAVIYEAPSSSFHPHLGEEIENVKRKFGIKKDYILSVSTRSSQKLAKLLDAYEDVKKNFDIDMVVVGDVEKGESFIKIGFLEDEDLARLYSGARVFVFPSLYEGFGLPVLEAMACGTPVVVSQTSSLPEVGGDSAVYVDPNNKDDIKAAIEKILNLPEDEYQLLGRKSLEQSKKFSWEEAALKTLKVYEEVYQS